MNMSSLMKNYALGIDLGTTYSCISIYRYNKAEIIPNEMSERTTPSVVTFLNSNTIQVGEETLYSQFKNAKNSVYSVKRIIGRFYDEELKQIIEKSNWPFDIIEEKKRPKIKIEIDNQIKTYFPEEISQLVLKKLLKSAEIFLGYKVNKAVITVPHNFTKTQREATKKSAELAGIDILQILSEPTAAALAYGLENKLKNEIKSSSSENLIFVFDLGGGTLDITLLKINENINNDNIFSVIGCSGDNFLGGDDFDNKLLEECLNSFCEKFKDSHADKDEIKKDKNKIKRLKRECEKCKINLSNKEVTNIYIKNFFQDIPLDIEMTRSRFYSLCSELFDKITNCITKVLDDSKKKKEDISEVVLIGGSSKMPKIKEKLSEIFKEANINCDINPDEAVAKGAAIFAAQKIDQGDSMINNNLLFDITPLALGTSFVSENPEEKAIGLKMSPIIKKNSRLPISLEHKYTNHIDNQKIMKIDIYEGNKKFVKDNHLIGFFNIELPPGPAGTVIVIIKLTIDINGILIVTATIESNGLSKTMILRNDREIISNEEFEKIKNESSQLSNNTISIDEKNYKNKINFYGKLYLEKTNKDEKISYLKKYNSSIKEYMNTFNEFELDNPTMNEKIFLYTKLLFESYNDLINYDENNDSLKSEIKEQNKKYIKLLFKIDPYCIIQLINIYKIRKELLYDLVLYILELYYEKGIYYLNSNDSQKNYKARNEFINGIKLYNKFIDEEITYYNLKSKSDEIISNIKTKVNLIDSSVNLKINENNDNSKLFNNENNLDTDNILILSIKYYEYYDKHYTSKSNMSIEIESFVLANIVKIDYVYLKNENINSLKHLKQYAETSLVLAESIPNKNWESIPWYKELKDLLNGENGIKKKIELKQNKTNGEKVIPQSVLSKLNEKFTTLGHKEFLQFILNDLNEYKPNGYDNLIQGTSFEQQWNSNKGRFLDNIRACYQKQIAPKNTEKQRINSALSAIIIDKINQILDQMEGCYIDDYLED